MDKKIIEYLESLKLKKGILMNFPQTTKEGPGEEVGFLVVG